MVWLDAIPPFASLLFYLLILLMHQKELHIVRFSMLVLFSALMIIYLLLYQIKWDDIVNQLGSMSQSNINSTSDFENLYSSISLEEFDEESILLETQSNQYNKTKDSDSLFENVEQSTTDTEKIIVLSWTSLRYGRVDAVEKLWISYQYALKDSKDIYYVFLDPQRYDFDQIIKALWGTTYSISTEKEIVENQLFWDKVTFINLKEYENEKVIILLEIDKMLRLLQIDYWIYHNSKWHIKQLFIN